jgi:hypothetical protein
VQGPQGNTGGTGPQGATGTQGPKGDAGVQGAQGAAGAQGATGSQGAQGATGATGSVAGTGSITQSASTATCTAGNSCTVTVTCAGSLVVTGGGLQVTGTTGNAESGDMHLSQSYPSAANKWTVVGTNVAWNGNITIRAIAICTQ